MAELGPDQFPRIVTVGFSGMLVNFSQTLTDAANQAALSFRARLEELAMPGVLETTTSLTSTFVIYDPLTLSPEKLRDQLVELAGSEAWDKAPLPSGRHLWRVPAVFDDDHGPQLHEAAELAGVSVQQAIESLCDISLRVMTLGFAPGQPYLGTLPEHWDIPRQTGLTKQVPVGAITVAIRQIVLFANASPTGWRQVGQCAFQPFRAKDANPIALRPGDEVSFFPITAKELAEIRAKDTTGDGGATCKVIE